MAAKKKISERTFTWNEIGAAFFLGAGLAFFFDAILYYVFLAN